MAGQIFIEFIYLCFYFSLNLEGGDIKMSFGALRFPQRQRQTFFSKANTVG